MSRVCRCTSLVHISNEDCAMSANQDSTQFVQKIFSAVRYFACIARTCACSAPAEQRLTRAPGHGNATAPRRWRRRSRRRSPSSPSPRQTYSSQRLRWVLGGVRSLAPVEMGVFAGLDSSFGHDLSQIYRGNPENPVLAGRGWLEKFLRNS